MRLPWVIHAPFLAINNFGNFQSYRKEWHDNQSWKGRWKKRLKSSINLHTQVKVMSIAKKCIVSRLNESILSLSSLISLLVILPLITWANLFNIKTQSYLPN